MEMFRYALELAYRGSNYHGWQIQPNAPSVQEEIEKRLKQLMGNTPVSVVGCGRTDTGVHASYYVCHVDLSREIVCQQLVYKLNKMLPDDITLFSCTLVSELFHARFSAVSRSYHYWIHQNKDSFKLDSYYLPHTLDLNQMNLAAELLLGTHDFTSFSKLHTDVKTNICTVKKAVWTELSGSLQFEIQADRFLRNMVRAVVGTLLEVGMEKIKITDFAQIIEAKDRGEAKLSVPAKGLFLVDIMYPENQFLAPHRSAQH